MESQEIKSLLAKYWEGETTLSEESKLRSYFNSNDVEPQFVEHKALFVYFTDESVTKMEKLPSSYIKEPTKVFSLNSVRAIAAALVLLCGAIIGFNFISNSNVNTESYVQNIDDPEEALEITKEALAYLSVKYKKALIH